MGKVPRVDVADLIYHVWNRGNAGGKIFLKETDFIAFENIITQAVEKTEMRILAYCIMPNHWHFVLQPRKDGDLSLFLHWLTLTHTARWQVSKGVEGSGHLYQGTYKSNICESDEHFLQLVRYVERNALRAKLVKRAEDWRWSSGWIRVNGDEEKKKILCEWPFVIPKNYSEIINKHQDNEEIETIRSSIKRGSPYGGEMWKDEMVTKYSLQASIKPRGRPKKGT